METEDKRGGRGEKGKGKRREERVGILSSERLSSLLTSEAGDLGFSVIAVLL